MGIGGTQEPNERRQLPSQAGRDSTQLTINMLAAIQFPPAPVSTLCTLESLVWAGPQNVRWIRSSFGVEVVSHARENPFTNSAPIHPVFRRRSLLRARALPIEHHHIPKHMAQLRRAGV